jgi:hypothetical protein
VAGSAEVAAGWFAGRAATENAVCADRSMWDIGGVMGSTASAPFEELRGMGAGRFTWRDRWLDRLKLPPVGLQDVPRRRTLGTRIVPRGTSAAQWIHGGWRVLGPSGNRERLGRQAVPLRRRVPGAGWFRRRCRDGEGWVPGSFHLGHRRRNGLNGVSAVEELRGMGAGRFTWG